MLDLIVAALVAAAALGGAIRGFVEEVVSLAAWALGLVAIRFLHPDLTAALAGWTGSANAAALIAFAALLLVPLAGLRLAAAQSRRGRAAQRPSFLDRLLGIGFGAVRGAAVVVVGFSLLVMAYDPEWGAQGRPVWIVEARSYQFLDAASRELVPLVAERRAAVVPAPAA